MPRYVALEWDNAEARVTVARVRSGHVELDHVLAIPLATGDARSANELGGKVAEALKQAGIAGGEAIVAVGRSNVELRFLTVPPVPADELADLVRFQAARQFSQPIEEGLIDYTPLASSGNPPTSVLAAVITPELLKTIRGVCEVAKLTPKHLVLRPFAADSLVTHQLKADNCVLTVDRLAEEVDLTVVLGEQAVFPRSVRVGNYGDAQEQANTVVAEMRRTIAAAQNQIAGHRVEGVYIFGRQAEQSLLGETVTRELEMPVEFVDPVAVAGVSAGSGVRLPDGIGRFAPLIGALVDESHNRRHEIDFLSPRKRPEAPSRNRLYTILGSAAAVAALLVMGTVWWQLSSLSAEVAELQEKLTKADKLVKTAAATVERAEAIDGYVAGQVLWLDEIKRLATELPPPEAVVLNDITGSVTSAGASQLILGGAARQSADISELENRLRSDRHRVSGSGGVERPNEKLHPWAFTETLSMPPRDLTTPATTVAATSPSADPNDPENGDEKTTPVDATPATKQATQTNDKAASTTKGSAR
jgi:Tfp pilus assembly PilM family ATPase